MGIKSQRRETLRFHVIDDGYANVLIVEACTGIYLDLLLDDGVRIQPEVDTRARQGMTVDKDFGTVFVHGFLKVEQQLPGDTCGELTLVGHLDGEACRLVVRNVRYHVLVGPYLQVVQWHGLLVKHCARHVVLRSTFLLVGL